MLQQQSSCSGAPSQARPNSRQLISVVAVVILLVALVCASIAIGARPVTWSEIEAGIRGSVEGYGQNAVGKRVVRTLLALAVGAALGLSGAVMQGATRNPLADPGLLGVNLGASLAVATSIATFGVVNSFTTIWIAILGAAATAVFVFFVGSLGYGGPTPLKIALAGAATSAAAASFISAIVLTRGDIATNVQAWQIGGVGGSQWASLAQIMPFLAAGVVICLLTARALNSLALGDEVAASLGNRVALARIAAGIGAVLLCGAATAVAGPIGFVGLVVPHACRLLVGIDHRWLLPVSTIAGGVLLLGADIVGRVVARPDEVAVGIVTALLGAPFFIAIVRRHRVGAL